MTDPQQSGLVNGFPAVGRWSVTTLPRGWMYVANLGIKQMTAERETIPASVVLGEDVLSTPDALPAYIAAQVKLIEHTLLLPRIAGPQPLPFPGAEEAYLLFVRHTPEGMATMLHVQRYVRSGIWAGIITLTVAEAVLPTLRPDYEAFVKGLHILPAA